MPLLVGEFSAEEGLHEILRQLHTNHPRAEHQHVDVVVLYSLMRRIGVVTHAAANPWQFIYRHARADTAAADQNAPLSLAVQHRSAHGFSKVRIIIEILSERTDVHALVSEGTMQLAH